MSNSDLYLHISLLLSILALVPSISPFPIHDKNPDPLRASTSFRFLSQCARDTYYVDGTCMKVCPAKYYGFNNLCWSCSQSCDNQLCISGGECNPCQANNQTYIADSKTCVDQCPSGYFEDFNNKICVKCAEGCTSCTYPNGLCESNSSHTGLIIGIVVLIGLLILAGAGIIFWRKYRKSTTPKRKLKKKKSTQQPRQDIEAQSPATKFQNKLAQLKKLGENPGPVGPYNIMPEDFNQVDDDEDENAASPGGRTQKRRLTNPKLLTASLSKNFKVDDSNEEQAVTHNSAVLRSRSGSMVLLSARGGESPAVKIRKLPKKMSSQPRMTLGMRQETLEPLEGHNDESGAIHPTSMTEVSSPAHGLTPKRENTIGFNIFKKLENVDVQKENVEAAVTVENEEEHVDKIDEAEEIEEDDLDKKEKDGYNEDWSMESRDKERDGVTDLNACTICGMNKKDCINKPCGHIVGCYACMRQFRESYGVCPKCKLPLRKLERTRDSKTKKSLHSHREEAVQV